MSGFLGALVAGLVGALAAGLITFAITRLRDRQLRHRHPVAGRYATVFEDRVRGRTERTKATAVIHQRGLRLWGLTWALDDMRSWHIDARINSNGKILGTYRADAPTDVSFGGLFLESLGQEGRFEGMWAGFDAENRSVSAGKYTWSAIPATRIRQIRASEAEPALSILGEGLGARYIKSDEFARFVNNDDGRLCLVAIRGSEVVGAATGLSANGSEFILSLPTDMQESVRTHLEGIEFQRVGQINSVAVADAAHGTGVGTALVASTASELCTLGATWAVVIGWTTEEGCHIQSIVEALRFHEVAVLPGYWREDSIRRNYGCPRCGQPCNCEAKVFLAKRADLDKMSRMHREREDA